MTDIAKTRNVWYEARQYNYTQTQQVAQQDEALVFPLLQDANNYTVGVNKAIIPLNSIPLTNKNLPLKYYQVGLQQGQYTGTAFIRQINSTNENFIFNATGLVITRYKYTSSGTLAQVGSIDVSSFMSYLYFFVYDDYLNLYCAGSKLNSVVPDTLFIISPTGTLLQQSAYSNITSLYINGVQNLFVADEVETGSLVSVYSNNNGENTVNLTLMGYLTQSYAGQNLNNISFVCATLSTILVGHDNNVITFYNDQLTALSDYTVAGFTNLSAGNVLNGENTFIVANSDAADDAIYSTRTDNLIWLVNDSVQQTLGSIDSAIVFPTGSGLAYAVGGDKNLYSIALPLPNLTSWQQVNNDGASTAILATDKGITYNIDLTRKLRAFNLLTGNNQYQTICDNFYYASPGDIISMDFNPSTNKIVAITNDNNLHQTTNPVYPLMVGFITPTLQFSNYELTTNSPVASSLAITKEEIKNFQCTNYQISPAGDYYFIEGTGASTVLTKRNPANMAFTLSATYTFPYSDFSKFAICGAYTCILQTSTNNLYVYDIDTTNLVQTIPISAPVIDMCSVDNNKNLGIILVPEFGINLLIVDVAGGTEVSSFPILGTYTGSVATSLAVNTLDQTNGTSAVFVAYNYTDGAAPAAGVELYRYTAGYASIQSTTQIYQQDSNVIGSIACNSNLGLLFYYLSNAGINSVSAVYQAANYSYASALSLYGDLPPQGATIMRAPNNIDKTITWQNITCNIPLKSITTSKTATNTLYGVSNADNTIYSGSLNSLAITMSQILEYASQNTNLQISSIPLVSPVVNSIIRTYTVSSQQQLGSVALTNQKVQTIAKNELQAVGSGFGEFLVPTNQSSKITSYSTSLGVNYQLALATTKCIFAKNGEDIDAGAISIYSYAPLINAINVAFAEAYARLKQGNPNPLAEAPQISLDYASKLCTLTYSADYTLANNGIYFNNPLNSLITFNPSTSSIIPALPNMFKIILPSGSTTYTQTSGTIYQFNQLLRIGIESNTIFVGDSYFGNNQSNRIITTIDVPTDTQLENVGNLYYQPSFLRPYTLFSSHAIDRVQMDILYQYKDFTTYPLLLNPGSSWTVQLDFVRKF